MVSSESTLWFAEMFAEVKPTEFLTLTHSLWQFHEILQSKGTCSNSLIYSRLHFFNILLAIILLESNYNRIFVLSQNIDKLNY